MVVLCATAAIVVALKRPKTYLPCFRPRPLQERAGLIRSSQYKNRNNMDLPPEPRPKTRDEAERDLLKRLNAGEIKQSTMRVEVKAPKPCKDSIPMDKKSVPRTRAALQNLIKQRHDDLWAVMVGKPKITSKLKVHVLPAMLISTPCMASDNLLKMPRPEKFTFAYLRPFACLWVRQVLLRQPPRNASRYDIPPGDTIHIFVTLESLGDIEALGPSPASGQSPVWETELLHELVHEHQFKLIRAASDEGRVLMRKDARGFPGPGHDELFYTAICACARRMGGATLEDCWAFRERI
jgi:hypothetical protein